MNYNKVSESELLELIKNLKRLPKEDYKNFIFPKNVRSVYILPIVKDDAIAGFFFLTEPSEGYYFKSIYKEQNGIHEIIFQETLTIETIKSIISLK